MLVRYTNLQITRSPSLAVPEMPRRCCVRRVMRVSGGGEREQTNFTRRKEELKKVESCCVVFFFFFCKKTLFPWSTFEMMSHAVPDSHARHSSNWTLSLSHASFPVTDTFQRTKVRDWCQVAVVDHGFPFSFSHKQQGPRENLNRRSWVSFSPT